MRSVRVVHVGALTALPEARRGSLADDYAARAIALLGRAQQADHFKDPAAVARLQKTEDLESVRRRDDYRRLLQQVEAKGK